MGHNENESFPNNVVNGPDFSPGGTKNSTHQQQCCGSGYVFRSFMDPDPYSEYGSGFTHLNILLDKIIK